MRFRKLFGRLGFTGVYLAVFLALGYFVFSPIYTADSIIIPYSLHPYDICIRYPVIWIKLKGYFILFYLLSSILIPNFLYTRLCEKLRPQDISKSKKTKNNVITSSFRKSFLIGGKK